MKIVCARFADRIQHGAISTELRAICGGQRLELGNRFHTEGTTGCAGPDAMTEKARHVGVVQKIGLSVEAAPGIVPLSALVANSKTFWR